MRSLLINKKATQGLFTGPFNNMRTILHQQFHVLLPSIILANFSGDKFTSRGLKGVVISRFPSLLFVSLFQGWLVVVIVIGNNKNELFVRF